MSDEARVLELPGALHRALELLAGNAPGAVETVRSELRLGHPRLIVEVLSLKMVPAGAGVSYGHTFIAQQPTTLALAAMGYGDGLPRKAGNRAQVTIDTGGGPLRAPIVGRVAMNAFVVDTGTTGYADGPGVGSVAHVVVFGDPTRGEATLADWAASVGETPVSVLAGIAARATVRQTA